jgi:deazaflavin-dependent oxidoreductase (nitroreductase family)
MDLLEGEYEPAPEGWSWASDQVQAYEASGGREANILRGNPDWPIVVITSRGAKSGKLRKNPVMRVEKDGVYAAVASRGGTPENPDWYHNFVADPVVQLQDGPEPALYRARVAEGAERAESRSTRLMRSTRRRLTARSRFSSSNESRGSGR